MGWRIPGAKGSKPESDDPMLTETEVIAREATGHTIARLRLDLVPLQAEAESATGATGDPVRALADAIISRLADAGVSVDERTHLESALSAALVKGEWPPELVLPATRAAEPSGETVAQFNGEGAMGGRKPARGAALTPSPRGARDGAGPIGDGEVQSDGGAPHIPPELFEEHLQYPSDESGRIFASLVGLDEVKSRLVKEAVLLTQPGQLRQWSETYHGAKAVRALEGIRGGAPFLVFAGDVGTGKTALAESFGDAVARELRQAASLLRMSIQTRGSGIVGDMTRQIARAFRVVESEAQRTRHVTILLLDEADALAESRETTQMHHEDRAGVNALVQGVDRLRGSNVPALVVFCTNRVDSIDPAVRRRAADVIEFRRPDAAQRRVHLERLLGDLDLSKEEWDQLVRLTGARDGRSYGFTYSDIADRLVRNAVLTAFPDKPLSFVILERLASETIPTRPFENGWVRAPVADGDGHEGHHHDHT